MKSEMIVRRLASRYAYVRAWMAVAVVVTIATVSVTNAQADVVVGQTVPITNNDARMRPLRVAVVTLEPAVSQPSFIRINDPNAGAVAGGFTAPAANTVFPAPRPRAVRFSGANLAVGSTDTVDFDFNRPFGPPGPSSIPIRFDVRMTVFGPAPPMMMGADGPALRSTSAGVDMFSKAVEGGASGTSFLGVAIPANQYGYFYQFNAIRDASPDTFSVRMGGNSPASSGVLPDSWSYSALSTDLGGSVELGIGPTPVSVTDSMHESTLTGVSGVTPLSWTFSNGAMTANFATGAFGSSAPSAILWFTSPTPPDLGGPLGIEGENATLASQGAQLSSGGVIAPVPEPVAAVLMLTGSLALSFIRRRHKPESRNENRVDR